MRNDIITHDWTTFPSFRLFRLVSPLLFSHQSACKMDMSSPHPTPGITYDRHLTSSRPSTCRQIWYATPGAYGCRRPRALSFNVVYHDPLGAAPSLHSPIKICSLVAAFHAPPTTCTTHSLTVGKCLQMHRRTYMRPGRRNPTSLQSQHLTSCSDNNDDKPCCRAIADRYSQRPARWRAASVRPPTNRQTDSCIWCLLYHQPAWTPYRWRGGASATCQTGAVSSPLPCLAEHFIGIYNSMYH
ncbi:hypothetical protein IWX49DRAFT_172247 [Phyllosticta citricarpa]